MAMPVKLIRREAAQQLSENVIISFVVTLLGIRLFLQLTGYPQIGTGGLHIAHAIWGGVFLLAASLLALIFRNKSLLTLSSVLAGMGWAFFIDELGKFITADNDYFFRPAAPLIYLTLLGLWYVTTYLVRRQGDDARARIYHILDRFEEVIEASVDPDDLLAIRQELQQLSQERQDGVSDELAQALLHFLEHEHIPTREQPPSAWARLWLQARQAIDRGLLSPPAIRTAFPVGLAAYGALLAGGVVLQLLPFLQPDWAATFHAGLDVSPFSSSANAMLFGVLNVLRLVVAGLFLASARRTWLRQPSGWRLAHRALVLAIVAADLLSFYFSQFSAALLTVLDVAVLGWVNLVQRYWTANSGQRMGNE
jgi:hypothetical protein